LSPDLLNFGEWADLHRMRYISSKKDKVEIKTRNKDGKVCFNPQSDTAGKDYVSPSSKTTRAKSGLLRAESTAEMNYFLNR